MRLKPIAFLVAAAAAASLIAQPISFARETREVRAGVLLVESQRASGVPANYAPHVWYMLDRDNGVTPASWSFNNAGGQTSMTAEANARWVALTGSAKAPGAKLTKADAPYWEVSLAGVSDTALAQYDVLLLPVNGSISLSPLEREKLRKFLDQGGVLWVDVIADGPTIFFDVANPLPIPVSLGSSGLFLEINSSHPLVKYPNALNINDLLQAGYAGSANATISTTTVPEALQQVLAWVGPESDRFEPVAGSAMNWTVAVAHEGEGAIVATTRGLSATVNRGFNLNDVNFGRPPQVNRGFTSLEPVHDAAFAAAAKLVVNAIEYGSFHSSSRRDRSHSGDIEAPLLRRFERDMGNNAFAARKAPKVHKGRLVVSLQNGILAVYDADPESDNDNDGLPDDGEPDAFDDPADLIWSSTALASPISEPTVVEAPSSLIGNPLRGGEPVVNQIWVTDGVGQVHMFDLDNPGGVGLAPNAGPISPPSASQTPVTGPLAPTVHEGLVIVADVRASDLSGRLWGIDLATATRIVGSTDFEIAGAGRLRQPTGPPTVGYIPIQDSSGGVDRVVYVPTYSLPSPNPIAGLSSVWLGAKGESPVRVQRSGNVVTVTTRASLQSLPIYLTGGEDPHGIKISLIDPSGTPFSTLQFSENLSGNVSLGNAGELRVELAASWNRAWDWDGTRSPGDPSDDVGWRIDYTIDWSTNKGPVGGTPADSFVRGDLLFPDIATAPQRLVIGDIALGPTGNIFAVTASTSNSEPGGTLFCLQENGRGTFNLKYRYDISEALTINLAGGAGSLPYPETLLDEDPIVNELAFLNQRVLRSRFLTGPTVTDGQVFVGAMGYKQIFPGVNIETTFLMSFEADPAPAQFELPARGSSSEINLVQPDVARSANKTVPEAFSVLQPNQFSIERIGDVYRITLESMMAEQRGQIRNSLTASLPIIIRRANGTDLVIEPESFIDKPDARYFAGNARGRFSPLNWYAAFNGFHVIADPLVMGETIYMAGHSELPDVLIGNFPPTNTGLIYAMDTEISPNSPFLFPTTLPWRLQYGLVRKLSPAPFDLEPADGIKWPQFNGITDWPEDFRVRILQAALPEFSALNLGGGEGTLAVTGNDGLYAFSRSDFLVVDEGRISRFDPNGNPIWTTDQTLRAGIDQPVGTASVSRQLSRPNRMYPDGSNGYIVVDTGNDRVERIDGAGRSVRNITQLKLDPNFVPPGMGDSETLDLRQPHDVATYTTTVAAGVNPFTNPQPVERWVHYLIADTGNNRIVELVDRYRLESGGRIGELVPYIDANNNPQRALGVLLWHTPPELSGKRYNYNTVARTFFPDAAGPRPVTAFGFGNIEPGRASFGLDSAPQDIDSSSGYGGIVLYDGAQTKVITEFEVPALGAGTYLVETGPGVYEFASAAQPQRTRKIANLKSITMRYVGTARGPQLAVMLTDASGVYEVVEARPGEWQVRWMLPIDAYVGMRRPFGTGPFSLAQLDDNPARLDPQYARRLDSGEVLIVNGYYGTYLDGAAFSGEVFLADGSFGGVGRIPGYDIKRQNLGFNALSIRFELPPIQGIRGLIRPVFAERR